MILYNIIICTVVIVCLGVPNEAAAISGRRHARVMPGGGGALGRLIKKNQPVCRSDSDAAVQCSTDFDPR